MGKIKSFIKNIYTEREGEHFLHKSEPWSLLLMGRSFSIPLARLIARLPIKIHPNVITLFSFLSMLLAGICFFKGMLIYGAVFSLMHLIFDCTDGTLARLTNTASEFGTKLDFYTDRTGLLFMYFGLWWSQYYLNGQWLLGGSIIFAHYAILIFGAIFITNHKYKTIIPHVSSYYSDFEEGNGTFFFAPIFGVFLVAFPILVLLQFISYLILFLKQKEKPNVKNNIKKMLRS